MQGFSKNIVSTLLLLCFNQLLFSQAKKNYWQQQTDYEIAVNLNDKEHILTAQLKLIYTNNSPDTLTFIWFHLWPNAFKNDRSAFTKQMLENGNTDFYFSAENERGFINKLDFRKDNQQCYLEPHPKHQDIVKVTFKEPLLPKSSAIITTPFNVQLPKNFSRSGHNGQNYQITQWYPKPAVYDAEGWHEMPYLDQGEFYSEFGKFEVSITLPDNYRVGATGILNKEKSIGNIIETGDPVAQKKGVQSSANLKTEVYEANNVHDFAWFASKEFLVLTDTIQLTNGKTIEAKALFYQRNKAGWSNSMLYIKRAIRTKSEWIGNYPYESITVVDDGSMNGSGMEYPMITLVGNTAEASKFDLLINHEIGHNWFYGILGSNERKYPWLDEGLNTYYDNKYMKLFYGYTPTETFIPQVDFLKKKLPEDVITLLHEELSNRHLDQAINTPSEKFTQLNYGLYAYMRAGNWLAELEAKIGTATFNKAMQRYFDDWRFKHPQPIDLKESFEQITQQSLESHFALLDLQHQRPKNSGKKSIRPTFLFNLKDYQKHHTISFAPALGFNLYDQLSLGAAVTSYSLPSNKLNFGLVGLYGTKSNALNGTAHLNYRLTNKDNSTFRFQLNAITFSGDSFTDSTGKTNYMRFSKLVPHVQYVFPKTNARSTKESKLDFKTFFIQEKQTLFKIDGPSSRLLVTYPTISRYVNQLTYTVTESRKLYPYHLQYRLEQNKDLVRLGATGKIFFNYPQGGGLQLRAFVGKIIYLGEASLSKRFSNDRYFLNLTGPKGDEDFTFENYYLGRNKFEGFASQQIMERDGAFKVRTDLLSNKIGKTDDWLGTVNLSTTIPKSINPLSVLPIKIPIKLYADIGTYAEAWAKNANTPKLLYNGGLQVSLFNDVLNIYFPLMYSKVYKDYFLSTLPDQRLLRTISFSIAFDRIKLKDFTSF